MTGDPVTAHDAPADAPLAAPGLRDVWDRDHAYLVGLATRMLSDRAEAEDVVQEAFTALADLPAERSANLAPGWRSSCGAGASTGCGRPTGDARPDGWRARRTGEWADRLGTFGPVGRVATDRPPAIPPIG